MIPLQAIVIGLVVVVGTTVVFVRDPLRQVMTNGVYGLSLVVCFMVFQAPDVALSMLVVGVVAIPLVFLAAINRMRGGRPRGGDGSVGAQPRVSVPATRSGSGGVATRRSTREKPRCGSAAPTRNAV